MQTPVSEVQSLRERLRRARNDEIKALKGG